MPAIAIKDNGEFAEEILKDLIEQGYNGQELLQKFHGMNWNSRRKYFGTRSE